jgi:hypothetical protein
MNMRKILILLLFVSVVLISSCSKKEEIFDASNEAYPFYEAFLILMNKHTGLVSEETIYIGIDLFELDVSSQAKVESAIQEYCVEHDYELLIGTIDDLIGEGYIEVNPEIGRWSAYFREGIHFNVYSVVLSPSEISFSAMIWKSGMGATGGQFRTNLEDGLWKTVRTTTWVS